MFFCSVWPVRVFETLSGLSVHENLPEVTPANLMRQRSFFFVSSSFYMCSPTVCGVTGVLSMFRAGQKPFSASRSPVEWCIVDLGSRAKVGKYKIARNDPKFCPVIDFWILRTLYAGGDSVFLLRLAGRAFGVIGRDLFFGRFRAGISQVNLMSKRTCFFCFVCLLYVSCECVGSRGS